MEALALLVSFGCMSLAGLVGLIPGSGSEACCDLPACCRQKGSMRSEVCPMKAARAEMSSDCPTIGHHNSSPISVRCLCRGSNPLPSSLAAGHFDFRFYLSAQKPESELASFSLGAPFEFAVQRAGFWSPPEQPPEDLLS